MNRACFTGNSALVLFSLALGCGTPDGQAPTALPSTPAPERVAVAARESVPRVHEVGASVRSVDHARVSAETQGRVVRLLVDVGDTVERGQLLAELEAAPLVWARDAARAELELAESEIERVELLHGQSVLPTQALERAHTQRERARSRMRTAQDSLGKARVRSPADGVVEARMVSPGDLAHPGSPLFTIHDPARLWLEARVPASDAARLTPGTEIEYTVGDMDGRITIAEVAPSRDPQSRTARVRASIDGLGLAPGSFGSLRYNVGARERVSVPVEAVTRVGQLPMVLVHETDGWHRRLVRLGETVGDRVEVLAGLSGDEEIGLP